MFSSAFKTMLYVPDVAAEKEFWSKMGFVIIKEQEVLGFPSFEMKISPEAECYFVVYDRAFIEQYSPELLNHQPNMIFFTPHIEMIYQLVKYVSPAVSDLNQVPEKNFSFESPSGYFYTVCEQLQ